MSDNKSEEKKPEEKKEPEKATKKKGFWSRFLDATGEAIGEALFGGGR